MTSHQYSANKKAAQYDFKTALKNVIAPAVAAFLVSLYSFVFFPLSTFMYYIEDLGYTQAQLTRNVSLMLVSSQSGVYVDYGIALGLVFLLLGAVFALFSFSFVMRKKKVNVFFSASVDRRTLFKNRVLASVLLIAVTMAVPLIADVIMNVFFLGHFGYVLKCAVLLFAECFVYALTGFAVMAAAMSFCTTVVESVFFSAGVLGAPTVVVFFIDALCSAFLRGYNHNSFYEGYYYSYSFAQPSLFHYTSIINPLILGKAFGAEYEVSSNMINFTCRDYPGEISSQSSYLRGSTHSGYESVPFDYILPIIVWAVISVCVIFIARRLFIKIKAENAGVHGTRPIASRLFAAECAITAFALWIYNYQYSTDTDVSVIIITTVLGVLVMLVSYFIIISVCKRTVKHRAKELIAPCASAAAAVVLVAVFSSGFFGYSTYVPEVEDIDKAVITTGATDFTSAEIKDNPFSDSYYFGEFFSGNDEDSAIGLFTDEEDLKTFTQINKKLVEKTDNMTGGSVCICYELKNGRLVSRYYDVTDYDAAYSVLSLRDTKAAREELTYLLTGTGKESDAPIAAKLKDSAISSDEFFYYSEERDLVKMFSKGFAYVVDSNNLADINVIENTAEFRQALLEDLLNQTYEQRFRPAEPAIGGVCFSGYDYNGNTELDIYASDKGYYIYPSMTNTINYLKSTGEYALFEVNDEIKSVVLKSCREVRAELIDNYGMDTFSSLFISKNDVPNGNDYFDDIYQEDDYSVESMADYFEHGMAVENPKQINELLDRARIFSFTDSDDYLVLIKYKNTGYVTKLIPADELPEWVPLVLTE